MHILWNDNQFARELQSIFNEDMIITSPAEFASKIKRVKDLLVLVELDWEDRRLTDCYGCQLVKEWIEKGAEFNIAFASFAEREKIKQLSLSARILIPIFSYIQLPLHQDNWKTLSIPEISKTKWHFIRRYVVEESGIIDHLEHKVKYLGANAKLEKVNNVLLEFDNYQTFLPREIMELVEKIRKIPLENRRDFGMLKSALEMALKSYKVELTSNEEAETTRSQYRIIIVEDHKDTLETLKKGFGAYFVVEGYRSGIEALNALRKSPFSYSALIIDIELLDDNGNWQPIQGYDLIEEAKKKSHLVVYMLSALSKQAISTIQSAMILSEVPFIPKDPKNGLPINFLTYNYLASLLQIQIESKRLYLKGPKNGVFSKGLLQYYYTVKNSQTFNWYEFWQDIVGRVEEFIEKQDNYKKIIPTKLFSQHPQKFNRRILETVLLHRLIVLYHQASEGEVRFEELREKIDFKQNQGRRYFNLMLGFSITDSKNGDTYKVDIQSKDLLLLEEEAWLELRMMHRNIVSMLNTILIDEYIPEKLLNQYSERIPKSISSIKECLSLLEFFYELSSVSKIDDSEKWLRLIAKDIAMYCEENVEELQFLERESVIGHKILTLLKAISNLTSIEE